MAVIHAPWGSLSTIRVRLTAALAAALLPVLILGAIQATLTFQREGEIRRAGLAAAAERSAATARARMEAADILLETLAPGSVGFQCAQRLAQVTQRIPGYANLIRFDRNGRVACAAADTPYDPQRAQRPWFQRMAAGENLVVTRDAGAIYARQPALLAAVRAVGPDQQFDGGLVAVISLASLAPKLSDASLPVDAEVALADSTGHYVNATDAEAFPALPGDWRARIAAHGSGVWTGRDGHDRSRVFSAAPLVGDDLYVILSARSQDLFAWAWINPLSSLAFPLLTFALSLTAVLVAADRVVIRWIAYLQRIAALYARGRFSVRPIQAEQAPPEIRDLAETLEDMADAIVARDGDLRENLAQKDALMREIHHRVKNNLQVITSLLNMQQRALSDPAARAAMSDTRQRITALALVYRALYQGPDLKQVDLRPFLEELTAQLIAGDSLNGATVETEILVDALVIDPDRLAPLALFTVEAITNAQKHAFTGRGGRLTVEFKVRDGQAALTISDDGSAPDSALAGAGVGRTLMNAFARQLRGTAELVRNAGGGISARLEFPTPAYAPPAASAAASGNQAVA
ncbi:sensor histidine kinase [Phenylobacterium aquaticum]|uniref:sensor histidine kinase PhyK n=1 Tax=Phenylobacterium aquaticum TaxID=1763816 RepID=UPI0026EBB9C5|nr:sensor histidine kinase [Phenylobacterium aquaticum]